MARDPTTDRLAWPLRLHRALMPDYNRAAAVYWWSATVLGAALLVACLVQVVLLPLPSLLQWIVGTALAVCAGLFPVRVPGTRVSLAAGEVCMFLLALLLGPAAAAVAAAAEAAMASYRTSKRWTSRLGSPAMATLAMYGAGWLIERGQVGLQQLGAASPAPLLLLAMAVALLYFLASATLMSGVSRLRRGERLVQLADVVSVFRWVGLVYAGSAAMAMLLYLAYRQGGMVVLVVMLPLLAMLLLVLHFYFRQQEALESMHAVRAAAAEREAALQAREADLTARHLRELQLSERRFRSAFTHASIGMALIDLDGRLLECNRALERLLGADGSALAGRRFTSLMDGEGAQRFAAKLDTARGLDFEDFDLTVTIGTPPNQPRRLRVLGSFFGGPAAHGSDQAGRPCLFLQVLAAGSASLAAAPSARGG
jgi:PAS domain-containing protein